MLLFSDCKLGLVVLLSPVSISLVGHQPDMLDPEDSFWCQALEDLETCGQSELLREIEVSLHACYANHAKILPIH